MIEANGVTYRVGKKALFEDVNIKFTEGNCYGIIGYARTASLLPRTGSGEIQRSGCAGHCHPGKPPSL